MDDMDEVSDNLRTLDPLNEETSIEQLSHTRTGFLCPTNTAW